MFERITPEIMTIAIAALAALSLFTFLMVLIKIISISRVKRRLLNIGRTILEVEEKHEGLRQTDQMLSDKVAHLAKAVEKIEPIERRLDEFDHKIAEAANRIGSMEHRLDGLDQKIAKAADKIGSMEYHLDGLNHKIAEHQNQLIKLTSKLNEHDTLLAQAGQMIGKDAAGFARAIQQIHTFKEEFQNLKTFQSTFEQIRNRLLDILGAMQVKMPAQDTLASERKAFKEEALIPSEEKQTDPEDLYQSRRYR